MTYDTQLMALDVPNNVNEPFVAKWTPLNFYILLCIEIRNIWYSMLHSKNANLFEHRHTEQTAQTTGLWKDGDMGANYQLVVYLRNRYIYK